MPGRTSEILWTLTVTETIQGIEPSRNDRVGWIDNLKGLGMFLIFLGHVRLSNQNITHYIYSFHVPLFFFLSGLFFKQEYVSYGLLLFTKRAIRTRLVPYISFGLFAYPIWVLFNLSKKFNFYHGTIPASEHLLRPLAGMLCGISGWLDPNPLLWFLSCLFATEILFFCIASVTRNRPFLLPILVACSLIGYLNSIYSPIRLPFSLDVAFMSVVFYGIGFISRGYALHRTFPPALGLSLFVVGATLSYLNQSINMNSNYYGNYLLFYVSSFSSIYAYMSLARNTRVLNLFSFIGRNSLIFLVLQDTSFFVINVFLYLLFHMRTGSVEFTLLLGTIYVIASMLLLIPACYFINARFPRFLGMAPRPLLPTAAGLDVVERRNWLSTLTMHEPEDVGHSLFAKLQAFKNAVAPKHPSAVDSRQSGESG